MPNVKNNLAAQATKRKLLDAAGEVFAELGFERATIKDITDRAGASVAAVNYHFSDKRELYYQVLKLVHAACLEARRIITHPSPGTSSPDQLRQFVRTFLKSLLDPARPAWYGVILAREMRQPSDATERLMDETLRPYAHELENLVRKLIPSPRRLAGRKVILLSNSIISQCLFFVDHQFILARLHPELPPPSRRLDELTDHITEFSLAALAGLYPPTRS